MSKIEFSSLFSMALVFNALILFIGIGFFYFVLLIYSPFIISLFLGFSMYLLFFPIFNYLENTLSTKRIFISLLTTVLITMFFIVPVFYVLILLVHELLLFARILHDFLSVEKIAMLKMQILEFTSLFPIKSEIISEIGQEIIIYFNSLIVPLVKKGPQYIFGLFTYVSHVLLSILFLFIFFNYGQNMKEICFRNIPFNKERLITLYHRVIAITEALIKGTLLISTLHGLFITVLFFGFGLSTPLLYGFLAAFASLIPILGTMLVWLPGAVYIYLVQGFGVSLWVFVILAWVSFILIENILKPYLLDKKLQLHPLLLFLSILGGIYKFGILGVVAGPFCITVFVVLWKTFIIRIENKENELSK